MTSWAGFQTIWIPKFRCDDVIGIKNLLQCLPIELSQNAMRSIGVGWNRNAACLYDRTDYFVERLLRASGLRRYLIRRHTKRAHEGSDGVPRFLRVEHPKEVNSPVNSDFNSREEKQLPKTIWSLGYECFVARLQGVNPTLRVVISDCDTIYLGFHKIKEPLTGRALL